MENRRSHRLQIIVIYVCFVMIMALWVDIFLDRYSRYNEEVLYEERLNQMKEVTTQLFTGLEDVVENRWDLVEEQINHLKYTIRNNTLQLFNAELLTPISIYNISGKLIKSTTYNSNGIDISNLANGIYIVKIGNYYIKINK